MTPCTNSRYQEASVWCWWLPCVQLWGWKHFRTPTLQTRWRGCQYIQAHQWSKPRV